MEGPPLPLNELKYNQRGLQDLRQHLTSGVLPHGVYNTHRPSFDAADIAWIATALGLASSTDPIAHNHFPPELITLRKGMPKGNQGANARALMRSRLQKLVFDLVSIVLLIVYRGLNFNHLCFKAALWDRAFGGASLIIHVEGTTRPNSPRLPNYTKADVYFPRHLMNEDPRYSPILSHMVQEYIVGVGLPVIERWESCAGAMWSLTLGVNAPVPQPYPAQTVPASIPNGSSTFVYHGRSVDANSTLPCRDIVDDYDDGIDELTAAELESLALVERCNSLGADLITVRAQLTTTENALNESLSREANLRAQLDAAQATRTHVTTLGDGLGSGTPVRRQLSRHPSPLPQMPTTPSRSTSYRMAATSPRLYRPAQPHSQVDSASPSQNSGFFTAPHVEALANYYDFLREHNLSGFIGSLDTLRKSIPISSWSEEMKHLDIPLDKIDTVMNLMANAG
jgi:hypothetical protein